MIEPLQLCLSTIGPPQAATAEQRTLYVQTALEAAVIDQDTSLVFPSLERLSGRFGISCDTAWRLRNALTELGYLQRLGHTFVTAHPRSSNEISYCPGEGNS